jgi:hypothetical protein
MEPLASTYRRLFGGELWHSLNFLEIEKLYNVFEWDLDKKNDFLELAQKNSNFAAEDMRLLLACRIAQQWPLHPLRSYCFDVK